MSGIIIDQETEASSGTDRWLAGLIYVLYILGVPSAGLSLLIGALIAYLRKPDAPGWLAEHYDFQIWTLIHAFVYVLISVALILTVIGAVIGGLALAIGGAFFWLWILIRCGVGLLRLVEGRGHPNPRTWWV